VNAIYHILILNPLLLLYSIGIILYTKEHFDSQRNLEGRWSLKVDKVIMNLIIGIVFLIVGIRPMGAVGSIGVIIIIVYSLLVGLYKTASKKESGSTPLSNFLKRNKT
jgi:hypothetical protein